ncbi:hypothetical protein, partial [Brevundimonas sp.]|uniref:hypothetical protein n=1 Tax=Brevundimonas sp. TaxID=1871086 RepID=UPI002AB99237
MAKPVTSGGVSSEFTKAAVGKVLPKCRTSTQPISLRMTFEEKASLDHDAAGMSIAAYIRWRLFDPDNAPPRKRSKQPVKDHQALAQLLALFGQ